MIETVYYPWFVLRTRSRQENIVETGLRQKEINVFLPMRKEVRLRKDRKKLLELPLFPGYVFVQPYPYQFEYLRFIPGSCGLILRDNKPAKMPERDLESVRIMVHSGAHLSVHEELIPGKKVEVLSGLFKGVQGELVQIRNKQRLLINAYVLGKSIDVEIGSESINILQAPPPTAELPYA